MLPPSIANGAGGASFTKSSDIIWLTRDQACALQARAQPASSQHVLHRVTGGRINAPADTHNPLRLHLVVHRRDDRILGGIVGDRNARDVSHDETVHHHLGSCCQTTHRSWEIRHDRYFPAIRSGLSRGFVSKQRKYVVLSAHRRIGFLVGRIECDAAEQECPE